jgi:quinol monooxygenase YgiN
MQEGKTYATGNWMVKEGKTAIFVDTWRQLAQWSSDNNGAVEAILIKDDDDSRHMISFSLWESDEQAAEQRKTLQWQAYTDELKSMCDSAKISQAHSVARVMAPSRV